MGLDMSASVNSSRNYSLERSGTNEVDSQLRDQLGQIEFEKTLQIGGYTSVNVAFNYVPTELGVFEVQLQVYMENFFNSPAMNLTLKYIWEYVLGGSVSMCLFRLRKISMIFRLSSLIKYIEKNWSFITKVKTP